MELTPLPGYALVKLASSRYKNIAAQQKTYEASSRGVLVSMEPRDEDEVYFEIYQRAINHMVFWEEYNTGSPIVNGENSYAHVKLSELRGYDAKTD